MRRRFVLATAKGEAVLAITPRPGRRDPYVRVAVDSMGRGVRRAFVEDRDRVPLLKSLAEALGYEVKRKPVAVARFDRPGTWRSSARLKGMLRRARRSAVKRRERR